MPADPPRRRISDRDRRRWSDERLDDRQATVDRRLEDLEKFERLMSQVPGLMQGLKERVEDLDKDVRDMRTRMDSNFDRNFREHKAVQDTAEEIAQTVKPGRLDAAVKYATIISFLLVPILAAWVASGQ